MQYNEEEEISHTDLFMDTKPKKRCLVWLVSPPPPPGHEFMDSCECTIIGIVALGHSRIIKEGDGDENHKIPSFRFSNDSEGRCSGTIAAAAA